MIIEKLKDLEQEAMDNLDSGIYEIITSHVLDEHDQQIYQAGYIDGLQTAINILSENSETMSYTVEMNEIFDDTDEEQNED